MVGLGRLFWTINPERSRTDRLGAIFCAGLALLTLHGSSTTLLGQVVTGTVLNEATGAPVSGATVTLLESRGRVVVGTDEGGRFRLEISDGLPLQISVSALGFLGALTEVTEADLTGPIRILLREAPLELPGFEASVEREENVWKIGPYFVTDDGLIWPPEDCVFVMSDSVVVKNSEWLKPEVWANYERARQWMGEKTVTFRVGLRRDYIVDSRVLNDAWPCGVYYPTYQRNNKFWTDRPAAPEPAGEAVTLTPDAGLRLPPLAHGPNTLAVSNSGVIAFVHRGTTAVHVIGPDGSPLWSLEPEGPASDLAPSIRLGWRDETLWVVDAARRTVTRVYPDGSADRRRDDTGLPAQQTWRTSERTMPEAPTPLDLALPIPAADGKWLWTTPAPDPPTPPIHPDDPPGRLLLALTDEWKMHRVLTPLRPGVKQVDLVLGSAPVLGPQPFRDHPLMAVDPRGEHVTVVEREHQMAAWMTSYRVTRFDLNGDTVFHAERRALMSDVTDDVVAAYAAELANLDGARSVFPDDPEADNPSAVRNTLIAGLLYVPPFLPSVSQLVVGFDGTTWLRWPDMMEPTVRWEVLDLTGTPVRTFELDRTLRIVAAEGDNVWATRLLPDTGETELVRLLIHPAGGAIN